MKNFFKLFGIIALVAVIGFLMMGCGADCGRKCGKDGQCGEVSTCAVNKFIAQHPNDWYTATGMPKCDCSD